MRQCEANTALKRDGFLIFLFSAEFKLLYRKAHAAREVKKKKEEGRKEVGVAQIVLARTSQAIPTSRLCSSIRTPEDPIAESPDGVIGSYTGRHCK
jgi:hypothetical protein